MHSPETALAYAGAVAAAWLLTYLVHSTLLIGAAWAVSRRVRRMAVHDLLWKVALVGGVATATLQLALRPGAADASARPAAALLAPVPLPTPSAPAVEAAAAVPSPRDASPAASAGPAAPAGEAPSPLAAWPLWLVAAWGLLAAARLGALARSRRALFSRLSPRRPLEGAEVEGVLDALRRAARFRGAVRLTASRGLLTPVAMGTREICVPEDGFAALTLEQRESILAHELAHLSRRDPFWLSLSAVVRAVLFVQPLNALAQRRLKETAEFLCDDAAVVQTGKRRPLVECLAHLAAGISVAEPTALPAMAETGSPLVLRAQRVLDRRREHDRPLAAGRKLALAGSACAAVAVLAPGFSAPRALAAPLAAAPVRAAAPAPPAVESPLAAGFTAGGAPASPAAPPSAAGEGAAPETPAVPGQGETDPRFLGLEKEHTDVRDGVVFWHDKVSSTGVHVTRSPRRVVGIERGGSLVAVEQRGERRRELRVTRGPDGSPVYGYTVNGRGQPFEGEARAWLDAILATRFPAAPPPRPAS